MQIVVERLSAQILPFTARSIPPNSAKAKRLTMLDRIQALEWEAMHANPAGARIMIHGNQFAASPEIGDYIGIYRAHEKWLVWGAARDGAAITIWHGPSGADFGTFDTMKAALAAVCTDSIQPRRGR